MIDGEEERVKGCPIFPVGGPYASWCRETQKTAPEYCEKCKHFKVKKDDKIP